MQYNDLSIKLNNSLEIARSLKKPEIKDNALIVSDTSSRPAAKILYISLLNSGYSPFLYTPAEISVYVLPYNEKYSNIIIFSSSQKDSRAVHAAEVATIMNYNVTFISPNMNEALEERLDYLKVNRIKINSENPVITMSLASLIWSPPLMGFREDRIRKEISEIGSSYDWLINNYKDVIEKIRNAKEDLIFAFTPSTEPGALYACNLIPNCYISLPIEQISNKMKFKTIILTSTAESQEYKDIILANKMSGLNNEIVEFNTDPIMTGIYSMLFISLIAERLI